MTRLLVARRVSAVRKPGADTLPDLAAGAAKLQVLPTDTLWRIHRMATISIARLETEPATPTS